MKFRSVGERIESFMATWLNSQEQGIMLNDLDMETDRKANIVGSLTNLSHEADALVQRCSESGGLASVVFSRFLLIAFHGSLFVLDVPCAPNIEPSSTGRSTVNAFAASYSTLTLA